MLKKYNGLETPINTHNNTTTTDENNIFQFNNIQNKVFKTVRPNTTDKLYRSNNVNESYQLGPQYH